MIWRACLVVIFFLRAVPACCQHITDLQGFDNEDFIEHTCVYTDSTRAISPDRVARLYTRHRFRSMEYFGDNIGVGNFNYWVVFKVKAGSSAPPRIILEVPIARLDSFSVYRLLPSGRLLFVQKCLGVGADIDQKPLFSFNHAVAVDLNKYDTTTLFLKINKYPGSVRSSVIVHTPKHFERKQKNLNRNLSVFLCLGILVILSSGVAGYISGQRMYYTFSVLTLFKTALNLQMFNYSQIFYRLGLDRVGTSAFVLMTLFFQYLFFKLYFKEKPYKIFFYLVSCLLLLDFFTGFFVSGGGLYYSLYALVFILALGFLWEISRKWGRAKKQDLPLLILQLLILFCLFTLLLKQVFYFANGFFRKHEYEIFLGSSISEMVLYFIYLTAGIFRLYSESKEKTLQINRLQSELLLISEAERQKIATDLHDDLGSTLAVLKDKIENGSGDALTIVQKAMKDLRSISHQLMPHEFELLGLKKSLERFADENNHQHTRPHISLVLFGETALLSADKQLNVYRILTELIHNSRKHSKATELTIELTYRPDCLHVSFTELDGQPSPVNSHPGIGLKSIASRLQYLNAAVLENSFTPTGYNLTFEIKR